MDSQFASNPRIHAYVESMPPDRRHSSHREILWQRAEAHKSGSLCTGDVKGLIRRAQKCGPSTPVAWGSSCDKALVYCFRIMLRLVSGDPVHGVFECAIASCNHDGEQRNDPKRGRRKNSVFVHDREMTEASEFAIQ